MVLGHARRRGRPWEAPETVLDMAGVRLSENHPRPIVDQPLARDRALAALDRLKRVGRNG